MTTQTRISLQDFLALPEEKPYKEWVNGEVYEKPLPNRKHGRLVIKLGRRIDVYLDDFPEAFVETEVRHLSETEYEQRVYLPDINVTLRDRGVDLEENPVTAYPDFVIEVLSPDDRVSRVLRRVDFLLEVGVQIVWLVDPDTETIRAHRQNQAPIVYRRGDIADARPVLAQFSLDISELFDSIAVGP